jgi:hypothetical protein
VRAASRRERHEEECVRSWGPRRDLWTVWRCQHGYTTRVVHGRWFGSTRWELVTPLARPLLWLRARRLPREGP